jgi:hypothetical protein
MDKESVMEKTERNRALAQILLNEKKRAYIQDTDGNFYFCTILEVTETSLEIDCFGPVQRRGQKPTLYFLQIDKIKPYVDFVPANKLIQNNSSREGVKDVA